MEEKRILLVEDNPDDVELTLRAFRQTHSSGKVDVAVDGAEALDYLLARGEHAGRPLPDVVLLDLKLPKLNGLEVLRELRRNERTRLLPVIILTSSNEERDVFESYNLGANSYIRKPVSFSRFVSTVQNLGVYWFDINEPPPKPS